MMKIGIRAKCDQGGEGDTPEISEASLIRRQKKDKIQYLWFTDDLSSFTATRLMK